MGFAGLVELTASAGPLVVLAVGMIAVNLYVFRELFAVPSRPPRSSFVFGTSVMVAQAVLWFGVAYYLFLPSVGGFVLFGVATQFMMVPFGIWFISLVLRQSLKSIDGDSLRWPLVFAVLLLGTEFGMSLAFAALAPTPVGLGGPVRDLLAPMTTLWFFWPMAATMALLWYLARPTGSLRVGIYALTALSFAGPWVIEQPVAGAIGAGLIMAVGLAAVLYPWPIPLPAGESGTWRFGLLAAFAAMSLGIFATEQGLLSGPIRVAPFVLASSLTMLAEVTFLCRYLLARQSTARATANTIATTAPALG